LLPFRINGSSPAATVRHGHPATDLGDGPVGQLHDVEMVHDQQRVWQRLNVLRAFRSIIKAVPG
jgi:hypothetical protein